MKQETMGRHMQRTFDAFIMKVREEGQKEYAGVGFDSFANFQRIATDLKIDRKKILWVYAMKHRDGIASYLRGHESQREDVRGRIKDLITYLFLLWGMIDEEFALESGFESYEEYEDKLLGVAGQEPTVGEVPDGVEVSR